jgi:PAS domain S-box-containing protein
MAGDAHFLELIDALPAIVWRGAAETVGISFVNRAAESILGHPRQAWIESPTFWRDHIHPKDRERVIALCMRAERDRRPYSDEYRMLTADGRAVWLRETVHFLGGDGGLAEVVGVMTDITLEKEAEASLAATRARFELVARASHDALWDWDLLRNTVWRSEGYERFLGFGPQAGEGPLGLWQDLIHPQDVERVMRTMREAIDGAAEEWTSEYRLRRADGEWATVADRGFVVRDPAGHGVRMLGAISDVSDRVRAEESRRAAQQAAAMLAAVVENSQDAISSIDLQGRIVSWNPASEQLSGFAAGEVIGRPISDVIPADRQRDLDAVQRVLSGSPGARYESEALRKDGARVPVSISVSPVRDESGEVIGASAIVRDISAERQREHERDLRLRRLSALRSVDLAISASLDLRIASAVILEQMTGTLGLDAAAILLFNPDSQGLRYGSGRGFAGTSILATDLRLGQSLAGDALLRRRTAVYPRLAEEQLAQDPRAALYADERVAAYVACPLIAKGRPMGVLEGFHRSPLEVDGEWREFFETLAGHAAIAIDNGALFEGLQRSNAQLRVAYDTTIEGWSRALDLRDQETEGHSRRVTDSTLRLARALGLRENELVHVRRGALLHDIGKLGIPDAILHKLGPLDEAEREILRRHPQLGRDLLAPIPHLRPALDIPWCHHEKWDGSGYPRGLRGEQIPLAARIFAVADAFDVLSSDRPYRAAWPLEKVRAHIAAESGRHFDPRVAEVFLAEGPAALR